MAVLIIPFVMFLALWAWWGTTLCKDNYDDDPRMDEFE